MPPEALVTTGSVDIESIFYLLYRVLLRLGGLADDTAVGVPDTSTPGFQNFYFYVEVFLFILGVAAAIILVHYVLARRKVAAEQSLLFKEKYTSSSAAKQKNVLWESVMAHLSTESQSEWKLAVIEADKILDDITVKQGFFGDTLGERLKNSDESLFRTLQDAWEAHKIRNRIAHEPGYHLTRREAQRAIGMYERVFKEFKVV